MNTNEIICAIDAEFTTIYRNASQFVNSGTLWDFCINTIADPVQMEKIVFANDLEIPPVKSLLLLYERSQEPKSDFKFTKTESQCMGALMGFVFKNVLGYTDQKDRCTVKKYGVGTAARFLNGPIHTFTSGE